SCEFDDVARGTNHDLAFERQLPNKRCAENGFANIFAHNKRADRANVNDTELRQLFSDQRRLAAIGFADVYRTKKDHRSHRRSRKEELRIRKFESATSYLPSAFTGADMPPMICHVPRVRIQVCVIRNASVLAPVPSLVAQSTLI